jgi:hypothetical protein
MLPILSKDLAFETVDVSQHPNVHDSPALEREQRGARVFNCASRGRNSEESSAMGSGIGKACENLITLFYHFDNPILKIRKNSAHEAHIFANSGMAMMLGPKRSAQLQFRVEDFVEDRFVPMIPHLLIPLANHFLVHLEKAYFKGESREERPALGKLLKVGPGFSVFIVQDDFLNLH